MAEIPVTKKTGAPWWAWLLLLLLLAGVGYLIYTLVDDDPERDGDRVVMTEGRTDGGVVVTYAVIAAAEKQKANPREWVGKRFTLSDLKVKRVTGDRTFWVTPQDSAREYLVALDEVVTPNTKIEGRYDVTAGQVVTARGVVKALDEDAVRHWGLTPEQLQATGGDRAVYFHADNLDITERPQ